MIAPVPSHEPTGATPGMIGSSKTWYPEDDKAEAVPGARYRLTMTVKAPYTIANIEALEGALMQGAGLNNIASNFALREKIVVESFQAHYPANPGASPPTWDFTMIFTKTGKGTPMLVIVGLIGLIVSLIILAAVVGHTLEKEGTKIQDLTTKATTTLTNPFLLVAIVIVILAVTGRNLKSIGGVS